MSNVIILSDGTRTDSPSASVPAVFGMQPSQHRGTFSCREKSSRRRLRR